MIIRPLTRWCAQAIRLCPSPSWSRAAHPHSAHSVPKVLVSQHQLSWLVAAFPWVVFLPPVTTQSHFLLSLWLQVP